MNHLQPDPSMSEQPRDPQLRQLRVLVVDDNVVDFEDLQRNLRRMQGYKVEAAWAKNLERARLQLKKGRFDVVFIDYHLGLNTGVSLMREFGGRGAPYAMVLLTGRATPHVQQTALEAGAVDCLSKDDVEVGRLETLLRYALHTHKLEQELYSQLIAHKQAQNVLEQKLLRQARELNERGDALLKAAAIIEQEAGNVSMPEAARQQVSNVRDVALGLKEQSALSSGGVSLLRGKGGF